MAMWTAARVAIPIVVPRALALWALSRLLFATLPLAVGLPFGAVSPSPIAVVLFAGVVGLVDVRVRGERILWANLGVTSAVLAALYAMAAIPAEWALEFALELQ